MAEFPSRPAPSWMQEHKGKILAALAGAITASIAVTAYAGWMVIDDDGGRPATISVQSNLSYPESRQGVRGQVDSDPSIRLGVTSGAVQPSSRESSYPASREGVRGHVDSDPSVQLGVTTDSVQPSARESKYPASRDGVRGPVTVE